MTNNVIHKVTRIEQIADIVSAMDCQASIQMRIASERSGIVYKGTFSVAEAAEARDILLDKAGLMGFEELHRSLPGRFPNHIAKAIFKHGEASHYRRLARDRNEIHIYASMVHVFEKERDAYLFKAGLAHYDFLVKLVCGDIT